MKHVHIVKEIEAGSIAEELGIEPGDKLISINDQEIEDVFDYHFYVNDEELVLLIEKQDGEEWELEIEKDFEEDLGIIFEQGLMDEYRSFLRHAYKTIAAMHRSFCSVIYIATYLKYNALQ